MELADVRADWHSTMYQTAPFVAGTDVWEISSVAFSSIKIDYSDYLKKLIGRINEVYAFSIKFRYSDILLKNNNIKFINPFVLLQSHL